MQYMLLIYNDEGERESHSGFHLSGDLQAKGTLIASDELQPVATATTVRVRDGDTVVSDGPFAETEETLGAYCLIEADSLDEAIVTDGPFAETKEALGGYYVIEADSPAEAEEIAARVPSARLGGTVEVRPVVQR